MLRTLNDGVAPPAPKPPSIALEKPAHYAGAFKSAHGDSFEVAVEGDHLILLKSGRTSRLQQAAGSLFATTDPDFAVTGVVIEVENEKAVRAWVGETEYLVDLSTGFKSPAPDALRALAGRYDNDDRWAGPLYVYAS